MKNKSESLAAKPLTALLVLVLALIAFLPINSRADSTGTSFSVTNNLSSSAATVTGWPTNQPATNGQGLATGLPINVDNYRSFAIELQGFLVNTNAANGTAVICLTPCGSCTQNPPTLSIGTNVYSAGNTVTNANDFTTNGYSVITIPLPGTYSNWFHFRTNYTSTAVNAEDTFFGWYQLSNSFAAGCFISNSSSALLTIKKKITPFKLP